MKMHPLPFAGALILAAGLGVAPVHAQQARSFVSGLGNDANAPNCTRTAPCRTFQAAHDNTLANGEITVLDPGSYGAVTITKDISIINDGVGEAGLLVSGGHVGIGVAAPADAAVTLRGLTIKGIDTGNGIVFAQGAALNVENCTIRNLSSSGNVFLGTGIFFTPTSGALQVTNTMITDNTGIGILLFPSGTADVTVVLDHVGLYHNGAAGLLAVGDNASGGTVAVTVNESVASNNGALGSGNGVGFGAQSASGKALTTLFVNRSVTANNPANGISVIGGGVLVSVNESAIFNNASGWVGPANSIFSYGNNVVQSNGANQGPMPHLFLQ